MKWPPKNKVKTDARVERGKYRCNQCKKVVPASVKKDGKRVNNVSVDHIKPVVNPSTGFTTWDDYVERLFVEKEKLQALCKVCHDKKTKEEREQKKKHS